MPGRGPLTFKKKQRELLQKEKQAEKLNRRLERKRQPLGTEEDMAQETAPDSPESESSEPGSASEPGSE